MGEENKEIGKLLELLNEYLSPFSGYIQYHNGNGFKRTPTKSAVEGDRMLQDEYVLGKSFGFIKWLVENDKIDTDGLLDIYWETRQSIWEAKKYELYSEYKRLLMLLSLQDEPIEFLCRLLK